VKPGDDRGMSMIELLVAMLLLGVGIMALAGTLSAASGLTLISERQTVMSHVGRNELERLQSLTYGQLALTGNPGTSTSTTNPDHYVSTQNGNYFLQWDRSSSATEQIAIDATNGQVSPSPRSWSNGNIGGQIYDFVTYHTDAGCGSGCPASQNYKRIVVEVTLSTAGGPKNPVIIQTLIASPNAAPTGYVANGVQNPLQAAGTQCTTGSTTGPCQVGIDQGTANSYWLYDTPATGSYSGIPTVSNTLHDTVGILQGLLCNVLITLGCPTPDLMGTSPPPLPSNGIPPPLLNYSTDQGGTTGSTTGGGNQYQGGRILTKSSGTCSTVPPASSSSSNAQAETWVTPGVAASETINGQGGMTLFMQSANGITASVTLCVAIWVYPPSILNLISLPPIEISAFAFVEASLPTTPTPVSFTFNLGSATTLTIGKRIGVEVWLAASASANAAIQYDNPSFASQLQLNTSP
jgi:prepilin-type N-terminal cleavage/methylation domain-containing protein